MGVWKRVTMNGGGEHLVTSKSLYKYNFNTVLLASFGRLCVHCVCTSCCVYVAACSLRRTAELVVGERYHFHRAHVTQLGGDRSCTSSKKTSANPAPPRKREAKDGQESKEMCSEERWGGEGRGRGQGM